MLYEQIPGSDMSIEFLPNSILQNAITCFERDEYVKALELVKKYRLSTPYLNVENYPLENKNNLATG